MPVEGEIGDIPDYANCEVARINSGYKDDDDIGQGWDHVFRLLRQSAHPVKEVIMSYLTNKCFENVHIYQMTTKVGKS